MIEKVLEKLARGIKPELIEVANLISIIQEKDEEIKKLKEEKQVLSHYKYMFEQAKY